MKDSITGIPRNQVGEVVQDFVDDGAISVVVELMEDGTYTISAT
jgi:hypothetical protein